MRARWKTAAALIAMAGTALCAGAWAQAEMHRPGGWQHEAPHGGGKHRGRHGMHALRNLQLTDAQRDQMFKLFHDQAPARYERMKAIRNARAELREIGKAGRFDAARAKAASEKLAKAVADLAYMRAEARSKFRDILTDEQRAKLDAMHKGPRKP